LGKTLDGVFLAALLTVVGYSINDSVVVFDRIREQRRLRAGDHLAAVANDACLQTIPRTINTGLGAMFILLALYFLGGETLTDFALALLVGILVGTYSSVFTATPLAVALEGTTRRAGVRGLPTPSRPREPAASPPSPPDENLVAVGSKAVTRPTRSHSAPPRPRKRHAKKKGRRR
jgi:SecD/SecF fusion protein